jgi:parvulin-like peptidyl-prolyl isomerase
MPMLKQHLRYSHIALLLSIQFVFGRSDRAWCQESVLAKVGQEFITEEEFLLRFELTPGPGRQNKSRLETEKVELLYSLIAERLLALEAQVRGLDRDSVFREEFAQVRKLIVRDELYREEISRKVSVSPAEITRSTVQALNQRLVGYLYFPAKQDADFVRSNVATSTEIERFQSDSTLTVLRDSATVIWGEASPPIEEAAYRLKPGQLSPVIQEENGYYVLWLKSSGKSQYYASLQPGVLRERVADKIRLRKERARLDEFLKSIFRDETAFGRASLLKQVSRELAKSLPSTSGEKIFVFDAELFETLRQVFRSSLQDTAVVAGNVAWSLESILSRLRAAKFEISHGDTLEIFSRLNRQLKMWAQQELLAREGLRRGLDQRRPVQKKLEIWYRAYLAGELKEELKQSTSVTDVEVWTSLNAQDPAIRIPTVRIHELQTKSLDSMRVALDELAAGKSFEQVIRRWSVGSNAAAHGGVSAPFRLNERPLLGEIASRMKKGETFGPTLEGTKYVYFELLEKDFSPLMRDTTFTRRFAKEKNELLHARYRENVNGLLAEAGSVRGFSIFEERLKQLKVTPIPMVTFRILGFGGRMFEFPMVEKQTEWLQTDSPKTRVIP